jgi:hypothetical protein
MILPRPQIGEVDSESEEIGVMGSSIPFIEKETFSTTVLEYLNNCNKLLLRELPVCTIDYYKEDFGTTVLY